MLAANSVSQLSSLAAAWRKQGIIGIIAGGPVTKTWLDRKTEDIMRYEQ
jgi:hypothetical protein